MIISLDYETHGRLTAKVQGLGIHEESPMEPMAVMGDTVLQVTYDPIGHSPYLALKFAFLHQC